MKKIFVLHGWSYSIDKWSPFIKMMKAKNYEVVLLTIPGLTQKSEKVWTLDDYVAWLKETLSLEKNVILIGHSNGGRIAIAYAANFPEKIEKLILIDSAGIYHNELPIRMKRFIFNNLAKLGKRITSSEKMRRLLYKVARESDYLTASPQMKLTMLNLISKDLTPRLVNLKVQTLIIWGADDKTTPLSDGKLMHKLIANSKLYIIKNARHSPQFTHTKQLVNVL